MRRPVLYSPSARPGPAQEGVCAAPAAVPADLPPPPKRWRPALARAAGNPRWVWAALLLLALLWMASFWQQQRLGGRALTQKDIDAAVLHTLSSKSLPSPTARAADKIRPAVVRVVAYARDRQGQEVEAGVGTGLVIVDKGVILTNLHVVDSARRLRVVFADGSDSLASVTGVRPEQDLAVLQAHTVPDDLQAATLRGTADLRPGDQVVAVGFPFGIGPSVSSGVISGFGRSFRAPEGGQDIGNLIQFDAAANPGNSGGPLVTLDGEVVGVVTGILNPTRHRTFAGIGFAVPIESAAAAAGLPPF